MKDRGNPYPLSETADSEAATIARRTGLKAAESLDRFPSDFLQRLGRGNFFTRRIPMPETVDGESCKKIREIEDASTLTFEETRAIRDVIELHYQLLQIEDAYPGLVATGFKQKSKD